MRIKKKIPIKVKPRFAVVVYGKTEFWYLQMLKRNEKKYKVDIKPEIPQKKILSEQNQLPSAISNSKKMVFFEKVIPNRG